MIGCLKSKTVRDQEEVYWKLIAAKEAADKRAAKNNNKLDHTNLFEDDETRLPLEDCKRQILKNLQILERYSCSMITCNQYVQWLALQRPRGRPRMDLSSYNHCTSGLHVIVALPKGTVTYRAKMDVKLSLIAWPKIFATEKSTDREELWKSFG